MTNSQLVSVYQCLETMANNITITLDNLLNECMTSEERINLTKTDVSATELLAKLSSLKNYYIKEDHMTND